MKKKIPQKTFIIKNTPWEWCIITDKHMRRIAGEFVRGLFCPDNSIIYINRDSNNIETYIHELVHLYYYSIHISKLSIDLDNQEELFCELFSKNGEEILQIAKNIYMELNKVTN